MAAGKGVVRLIEISFLIRRVEKRIPAHLEKGPGIKEQKLIERGRGRRRHRVGVGINVQVRKVGRPIIAPADNGVDEIGLLRRAESADAGQLRQVRVGQHALVRLIGTVSCQGRTVDDQAARHIQVERAAFIIDGVGIALGDGIRPRGGARDRRWRDGGQIFVGGAPGGRIGTVPGDIDPVRRVERGGRGKVRHRRIDIDRLHQEREVPSRRLNQPIVKGGIVIGIDARCAREPARAIVDSAVKGCSIFADLDQVLHAWRRRKPDDGRDGGGRSIGVVETGGHGGCSCAVGSRYNLLLKVADNCRDSPLARQGDLALTEAGVGKLTFQRRARKQRHRQRGQEEKEREDDKQSRPIERSGRSCE